MRAIVPASGLAAIIDRFDGLIIDQNCIIHDDASLHPGALDALQRLATAGIRSIIVANSSESDRVNIDRLEKLGVGEDLYERLVSTGQLMRQALAAQALKEAEANRRYFLAATPEHAALFDGGRLIRVDSVAEADAVILLSLSETEAADPGRVPWLAEAAQRHLPIYTPKADVNALVPAGELTPGFALLLNSYRAKGGQAVLYGKPSGRVYARCLNLLDPIETERVASIGDQFPADIFGAREMGIEPILVGTGAGGLGGKTPAEMEAWRSRLTGLCNAHGIFELTVLPGLAW